MAATTSSGTTVLVVCAIDSTAWLLLRPQIRAMRDRGWIVTVACTDGPMLRRFLDEGISIYPVRISRSIAPITNLLATLKLYRFLRRQRFDVVHVHTPVASLVGRLAAWAARVPLILYTAHGFYFHENMNPRARWLYIQLERLFGHLTDFLFTQSREDAVTAVAVGIMPADRVEAIGNGVPTRDFADVPTSAVAEMRALFDMPVHSIVVGTIGRLVKEKGYRELMRAANEVLQSFPSTVFVIAGDVLTGERDPFVKEIAHAIAVEPNLRGAVRLVGFVSNVPAFMNALDVFVLASYREGMPRSVIEAMAAGKPVVATDIRGCREEVVDGVTGFLVPVRDADSLADRIRTLVTSPDLRDSQGRAGQLRAHNQFDESSVINRLLSRIDGLLAQHGSTARVIR